MYRGWVGALLPMQGGAPLPNESVSQYRCVNLSKADNDDRKYENDANALS